MSSTSQYSTLKNIAYTTPSLSQNKIVAKYLTYPDITGKRKAEGGLRVNGKFKHSLPDAPLITIITVCLNSQTTLEQCIQSVLHQTYLNIEYIIVDGDSTDGTRHVIEKYEYCIDYFLSEPDRGLYHAMNKGLELASGDYIVILNSDDWYEQDCVETLVKAKKYAGTSFVSALAQHVDQKGKMLQVLRSMPYNPSLRLRMPLRHETMLLAANIYNDIGTYDESYRIIADFHLTTRLFEKGYTHYEVPRPLLFFRNTGISSLNKSELFDERQRLIRSQFQFLELGEEKIFRNLSLLTPRELERIAKKYRHEIEFNITLKCYSDDRFEILKQANWINYDIDWQFIFNIHHLPLVSVIVPIDNDQETLSSCIDSVVSQTLKNLELICINDASSDDSQKIIERYRSQDSRVISLVNTSKIGLNSSRDLGIRRARGTYIFHIDSHDTIPQQALETLHGHAVKCRSDIIKGECLLDQCLPGQAVIHIRRMRSAPITISSIDISFAEMSQLLNTPDGPWSYLIESQLAKRVPYPADLEIGHNGVYLVSLIVKAKRITLINDVVYHSRAYPQQAASAFCFQTYNDALEWRRRAWHVLKDVGMQTIGHHLLQEYWDDSFFHNLASCATPEQLRFFWVNFRNAFLETGVAKVLLSTNTANFQAKLFQLILQGKEQEALALMLVNPDNRCAEITTKQLFLQKSQKSMAQIGKSWIKVAAFYSTERCSAEAGMLQIVKALRCIGVDVGLFPLTMQSTNQHGDGVAPMLTPKKAIQQKVDCNSVSDRVILPVGAVAECTSEVFSRPDLLTDFSQIASCFREYDVIHLHRYAGMLDYAHAGEFPENKPLVWTLADMNAFTGWCHFSGGCNEYTKQCRRCHMLGGGSELAHEAWQSKRISYQNIRNLTIVCPSKWMAEQVAKSSLLGERKIFVIPNAFPVERLRPANKIVARIRLRLPVHKKLVLVDTDNFGIHHKESNLLSEAIDVLLKMEQPLPVEIIMFGNNKVKMPLPIHELGYISDNEKLALVYSAADVFLFPTRMGGAPLAIGESLLCGTPVVAFPAGHVQDIVEHGVTGYIAKYLNVDDFAAGIEWALNIDRKAALIRQINCRLSAYDFHEPERSMEKYLAVYRAALKSAAGDN